MGQGHGHNLVVADVQRILVTGAAGKVGQAFISRLLASSDERLAGLTVRALCHNRVLEAGSRLEVVTGSIDQRAAVEAAADGVTHVLHLATSKETPETIIDVAVSRANKHRGSQVGSQSTPTSNHT